MKKRAIEMLVKKIQDKESGLCYPRDVEDLLKSERARVRRMVKKIAKEHQEYFNDQTIATAYAHVCDDILAKLKESK